MFDISSFSLEIYFFHSTVFLMFSMKTTYSLLHFPRILGECSSILCYQFYLISSGKTKFSMSSCRFIFVLTTTYHYKEIVCRMFVSQYLNTTLWTSVWNQNGADKLVSIWTSKRHPLLFLEPKHLLEALLPSFFLIARMLVTYPSVVYNSLPS